VSRPRRPGASARSVDYATSPLLASKTPPWRSRFVVVLVALGSLLLVGRAVQVQIVSSEFYQKQGEKRFAHTLEVPAMRGRVLDRNGQVLATSVPAPSIWVDPKTLKADASQRRALAAVLGMSAAELDLRLDANSQFVWLRRQVEEPLWEQVRALGIKGIAMQTEYRRKYPEGEAAAHVVGFTDLEERGQEGIELAFQRQLQGRDGARMVLRDRLGRAVEDMGEQTDPLHGRDVTLSIDSKVQFFAWQRLRDAVRQHGAKGGSAVVLDARTGEVLALANYPSYDPSHRHNLAGEQLRNRALTDIFEPGSTMKPFVAAQALQSGRVKADTRIDTSPGRITITGSQISDAHPHGVLTVAEIIQKSSNVGTVKMAMQMPPRELWELYTALGIGSKPRIDFPGAATGRLRPYKTWRPIEQATMSYGYGLSVSLLQLARAYTVFAHDGALLPLSMTRLDGPVAGTPVIDAATAQTLRSFLQAAAGPGGTAPKAQALGYSVGGKTGTARKQEGKVYSTSKYRAWFVGLAPMKDPRIVVAVMVDEPTKGVYYGGEVAAPVFSQVVQQTLRTLGVAPDIEVKPQILGRPAELESF